MPKSNNPYNPLDPTSVLGYLRKLHPNAHALSRISIPTARAGYETGFGGSAYISPSFRYRYDEFKRPLNLNEMLGVKLSEIAQMPADIREGEISKFAATYKSNYIYNAPRARALGRAGLYQKAGIVQDIDAMLAQTPLSEWSQKITGEGFPVSFEHIGSYMYKTQSETALMPGAGITETARKRSTLLNFNPVGKAQGFGAAATMGLEAPMSVTPAMVDLAMQQSKAYMYGASAEHVMERADRLMGAFGAYGQARMIQYSTDPRLQGGPFLYKQGLFRGQYAFPQKEILLAPSEIQALKSAVTQPGEEYGALIGKGLEPTRARRLLDMLQAGRSGDIMTSMHEPRGTRVIYGKREAIGPGSKLVVGGAKGLAAEVATYQNISQAKGTYRGKLKGGFADIARAATDFGDNKKMFDAALLEAGGDYIKAQRLYRKTMGMPDILAPILTGKEKLRHLDRLMEGAQIWLTHPKFQPDTKVALQNTQALADVINQHMNMKAVEAKGRALHFTSPVEWSQDMVTGAMGLLSPTQRAAMEMGRMPGMVYSIGNQQRLKFGRVGVSINDVAGLRIQGLHGMAGLYAGAIARNAHGGEVMDAFGFLTGRTTGVAGSISVGAADASSLIGRTTLGRTGQLENYAGAELFNPALTGDIPRMLQLGKSVKIDIGGAEREITELPLLSRGARGLKMTGGGRVYRTPLDRSYLDLIKDMGATGSVAQSKVQAVVNAMGTLGGKKGLVERQVARGSIEGFYGQMNFLSPEAEKTLQAAYGETGGFVGLTMDMAKKVFPGTAEEEIGRMLDEGTYLPIRRFPEAPRGTAVARAFLMDKEMRAMADFGKRGIYISPGIAAHIHGDLDQDMVTIETEWAQSARKNPMVAGIFKEAYYKDLPRYSRFEGDVIAKLRSNVDYTSFVQHSFARGAGSEASLAEVAEAAQFKAHTTGSAYIKGMQAYEGALSLGERAGYSKYTPEYASDLAQVLFGVAESGINVKRGGSNLIQSADLSKMIRERDVEGVSAMAADVISSVHGTKYEGAAQKNLVEDMLEAANYGRSGMEPYNQYRGMYRAKNVSDIAKSLYVESGAQGSIMETMTGSGVLRSASAIGQGNAQIAASAGKPRLGMGPIREGFSNFVGGLKEGRGWTSIAAGAAILAGMALGLRKPGNIYVQNTQNQNGSQAQVSPEGTYQKMDESRAPMIQPRRESRNRVMTDEQYNVKIRLRDIRKQDHNKFTDLAQAISGKYKNANKINVNLKDDTNDINYQRVFDEAYRKAMTQGRG